MKYLQNLTETERDLIRIKVGSSYLNLTLRKFHNNLKTYYEDLLAKVGFKYEEELKPVMYCSFTAIVKLDTGFYYSRNNLTYTSFNKNNPSFKTLSWRKFKDLIDKLEDLGYVESFSGYNDRLNKDSMSSCLVFTEKYLSLFDKDLLDKFTKETYENSVVVMTEKGSNGERSVKSKVKGIEERKQSVDKVNNFLSKQRFKFITCEKRIYLQQKFIESLTNSGRFYFGELQCIKKEKRILYEINDENVTERDYVSNHLFIIAELNQAVLPNDFLPYDLDVSDLIQAEDPLKVRKIIKAICMFLLNSGTPEASFKKFWKESREIIKINIENDQWGKAEKNIFYKVSGLANSKELVKRVEEHNNYAKNHFRVKGGCWGKLQFLDSSILLECMLSLVDKNIPFLPYHDSILVRQIDGESLTIEMENSWEKILGSKKFCKIKKEF